MLTSDVRKLFQRESNGLGHRDAGKYNRQALEVFDGLRFPGKEVEVVDTLKYVRSELLELASWSDERSQRVFGLDGGSSRTMVFRNGTIACANQALLVSERPSMINGVPLEAYRTLAWVTHSRDDNHTIASATLETHSLVSLWRVQLSNDEIRSDNPQRIQEVVKAMADVSSEPQHLVRMADLVGLDKGDLVFVDGRLYPTRLYRYLISGMGKGADIDIDLLSKDDWKNLIQASLDVIHLAIERDLLLIAINKTPESNTLLRFGTNDKTQRWHNDRQCISALFEKIPPNELGYTNWFVQALHPALQGGGAETMDFFIDLSDELTLKRPASDYHIAFFYVYDPRVRAALRVEVPRIALGRHDPERLQLLVLSHVARGGGGVPNAIRIADGQAKITQQEREALQQHSGLMPDWDYNHSRGAPH